MDTESRKRSCDELAEDGDELGLGGTTVQDQQNECGEHNSEMTKRSRKKQRKNKATKARSQTDSNGTGTSTNKPGLQFASHRLNSSVKLTDLRDLVLYCLADGVAPSWISVQNRNQFQKAVIVLVPGLEKSMFDGSQSLSLKQTFSEQIEPDAQAQDNSVETDLEVKQWTLVTRTSTTSRNDPDSYLPISLEEDKLQEPLKPLVKIFKDVWPIKATGDDRYSKVHSPLHSMLQRSIQETSEDKNKRKNMKGAKPVKVRDDFSAKKTPITEYIASLEELRDNSYVIHPALISDDMDKEQELEQREKKSTHSSSSWKDAIIDSVSDSSSPKLNDSNSSSSNDIFSGRTIYAVDCEMCVVGEDEYALTRISVLSWKGSIIMDELVKPEKPITNYLTQ